MERMSLTDAIRLGAAATRQVRGAFYTGGGDVAIRTCALGAALYAMGRLITRDDLSDVVVYIFPELHTSANCPECRVGDELGDMIVHMNDEHKWTRNQIAAWIDDEVCLFDVPVEVTEYAEAVTA
jgi:hypothetical protein